MSSSVQVVQRLGQSIWYDNIRRGMIVSGELDRLVDLGITGLTSNPTIFEKAIAGSTDYDTALRDLASTGRTAEEIFEALAIDDIQAAADLLLPVYQRTGGRDGYVSFEVNPALAHNTIATVKEARRLVQAIDRPNLMIKVPATPEGISAIRQLIAEGINVNMTLIFSLRRYQDVMEAYISGVEELVQNGSDARKVTSVASFFVSRVDTAVDHLLEERIFNGEESLKELLGKAAIANARLAYKAFKEVFQSDRFLPLEKIGARAQRPLWASTGTKNPAYSDVVYVDSLIGLHTINTIPPATLTAFLDHGNPESTLERGLMEAEGLFGRLGSIGIDIETVTNELLAQGVDAFSESFKKVIDNIAEKVTNLSTGELLCAQVDLGPYESDVEKAVSDLQERDVTRRIWGKDHTVWKSSPEEIENRLGWLSVTELMGDQVPTLRAFADDVRASGFQHIALLGMGGSSMGPEVLHRTFGSAEGYPGLVVLDSTVPENVSSVARGINPASTLFLISSKSGSTIEPLSFYKYFRELVEKEIGAEVAGRNFVAITDPGTSLERLAREQGFRRVFCNPPDIGGRYSVLSYFGLVPAALIGVDIDELLERADCMKEGCASCVPVHENPGAWLGAVMASMALHGRDKLTILTSPSISSFGLWAEQLVAESTGKEGKGVVPVTDEPPSEARAYGDDRLFVYLRVGNDDNDDLDTVAKGLEGAGHPVVRLGLRDRYDLGAEFFRWQFAVAVAGTLMDINPFDQPNVQQAKDLTARILGNYRGTGRLPERIDGDSLEDLLAKAQPGDYLAILAYLPQTEENDRAISRLRQRITSKYHIATTVGYGPRYLHSTGQLHKGGPNSGLFLQLNNTHAADLEIPGEAYTFGTLARAQALGDLQALQQSGRRVAMIQVGSDIPGDIENLAMNAAEHNR